MISPDIEAMNAPDVPPEGEATPLEVTPEQKTQQEEQTANDEREDDLLLEIVLYAEKEDEAIRYLPLLRAKRNECYFNNIHKIFYDEAARDYRTIDSLADKLATIGGVDDVKTVGAYRAYAESLIAALSISTPAVEFTPDDAENPEDIEAAKAYSSISELVNRHNHSNLQLIKALSIFFNQGIVAGYNYYKTDPAYGIYSKPSKTQPRERKYVDLYCSNCGNLVNANLSPSVVQQGSTVTCRDCGVTAPPNVIQKLDYEDEVVEWEDTPKGRAAYSLFGMTAVKVPVYAKTQADCGYVLLRVDDSVGKWRTAYDDYSIDSGGGDTYKYERWARLPPDYMETIPTDLTTGRYCWIRPWYYSTVLKEDEAQWLTQQYPKGVMVTVIGDKIYEKESEKLDDRWTITFDPRANLIHGEPAGNALVPLQDAITDTFNLGLQLIEYGVPETFAHPKTLNLKKYAKSAASPGMMTPALPPGPDKTLADGFHTIKAATLTNEHSTFTDQLRSLTEFVTGALPSIFGGQLPNGSDTATEYTESRARALQRLQITWQIMAVFWGDMIFKTCNAFAKNIQEDERYTDKKNGTFINVWIRKSSLQGKVGHIEPETNGQLPQSWSQKKDFLMSLIQLKDPTIGSILMHPNNSNLIKNITGMPEFYIPGENDRDKQYTEYYLLSQGQPISDTEPSIPIDIDVDDHEIHMLVLKNILVSTVGIQLYQTNPAGYQNNILHYRMHELAQQAKTMAPAGGSPAGQPPKSANQTQEG